MRNIIANIPFLKAWYNYLVAIKYKVMNSSLQIGHSIELKDCSFGRQNAIADRVRLHQVNLGDYSYVSYETVVRNTTIGKFCSIGPRCLIGLGKHPSEGFLSTHPYFFAKQTPIGISAVEKDVFTAFEKIVIGNDVWVGANVIIMDGIQIGDGAIIAAGSVVTKNVAPFSMVKGIPAKHFKYRIEENKQSKILANPWWNQTISEIKKLVLWPE